MIIARHVEGYLQIGFFDDRAEISPMCSQLRMSSSYFNKLADFLERKVEEAKYLRDNYHEDDKCKEKYHQGDVDSLNIWGNNPIVLITDEGFIYFKLIIGQGIFPYLCMNDLLELAGQLRELS